MAKAPRAEVEARGSATRLGVPTSSTRQSRLKWCDSATRLDLINIQLTSSTFLKRKKYTVNITVFLTLWKTQVPTNKPKK